MNEPGAVPRSPVTPSPVLPQRAAKPPVVGSALFRAQVLDAFRRDEQASPVLRAVSHGSASLIALALGVAVGWLALIGMMRIEVTATSRGVLRAAEGVKAVVARTSGTVVEILVQSGDEVASGQLLARMESVTLRASHLEAAARVKAAQEELERSARLRQEQLRLSLGFFKVRQRVVQQRTSRLSVEVGRLARNHQRYEKLLAAGLIDADEERQARALHDRAAQALLEEQENGVILREQAARAQSDYESELSGWQQRVEAEKAALAAAEMRLRDTELRAPYAGRVSGIRVVEGQAIEAGEMLARVVSSGSPNNAILFVPERDRAFVRDDARVRLELDQLPVEEFGHLEGRIARVAIELADPEELREELGGDMPAGAYFRVDARIGATPPNPLLAQHLRSGMQVTGRITLRERRILSLLIEPLRRWID